MTDKKKQTTRTSNKSTVQKTKIIGEESYINSQTGELVDFQVIDIREETDANFHKIWLSHILSAFDELGNQKLKVLTYLLENMNKENLIIGTQRALADKIGVSYQTLSLTLKILREGDIIAMPQSGVIRFNPNVIFKGYHSRRMNILYKYSAEKNAYDETPKQKEYKKYQDTRTKKYKELKNLTREELLKSLGQSENDFTLIMDKPELINLILKKEIDIPYQKKQQAQVDETAKRLIENGDINEIQ